ncbi:MAG: chorismate-binding protein [Bifidobacteriaceae bacterium]|jgi:phenazine biosynthesis protein phzE|nr:chorismate-binding protein [Bifidobacteriaceae bacterium]
MSPAQGQPRADAAVAWARVVEPGGEQPFALIRRGDSALVEILQGEVRDVATIAEIPLEGAAVLALVPFRQIVERGFAVVDDAAPLRCLVAAERRTVPVAELLAELPEIPPPFEPHGFDISDAEYAEQVKAIIQEEIGRGEGANFVLHRSFTGRVEASPAHAVRAWLGRLLRAEQGAYWTYAVFSDGVALAGASPERHISIKSGVVTMNPISGTYRHPPKGPTEAGILSFLTDAKEVDELFMVVDEELKLMSAICPSGGRVIGPYLKPMSKVTHTEYLLEGLTDADPRDVLRRTMFAPTVTGAPMENACAVIARRENRPRGYYAGVMALFEPGPGGTWDLDAPIMIRTAYVEPDGAVAVPAGATIVRHSDPLSEVAETRTKAAGVLSALGALPAAAGSTSPSSPPASPTPADVATSPRVRATLAYRNERLAPFWLRPQAAGQAPLAGLDVTIIDAADNFSQMLAHQLRRLGANAQVVSWRRYAPGAEDLVIPGPGPGDPSGTEERVAKLRDVIVRRLERRAPFLAVCLSHQILARELGLELRQLTRPHQGEQLTDDVFGHPATLGYYNTFTAVAPLEERAGLEVARRRGTDEVIALRGERFASLQGHPESALSPDGLDLLARLIPSL